MHIVSTILFCLCIILGIILFLLIVFSIIPLTYVFDISYDNKVFDLKFKFWFFVFELKIKIGTPLYYRAQIMHKVIADSTDKKVESYANENDTSISDTDFISDKSIASSVTIDRHATKEILKRAEEYNAELNKENKVDDSNEQKGFIKEKYEQIISFIDSFKELLPKNIIYVAKLIAKEWCEYYKNLLPKKITTNTEFGFDDPYSVGLVLSIISPFYALYGSDIKVKPHFDKNIFKSSTKIIGRPQIIFIIIPVIHLLLDKKFREVMFKGKDTKQDIDL